MRPDSQSVRLLIDQLLTSLVALLVLSMNSTACMLWVHVGMRKWAGGWSGAAGS
jgi:hypothetical protein